MSELINFEENLSEDLLDENASASRVNMSPNIDKNMSNSAFHFHFGADRMKDMKFCEEKSSSKELPRGGSAIEPSSQSLISNKQSHSNSDQRVGLKQEIKDLLHKAIRLRSLSDSSSNDNKKRRKEREFPAISPIDQIVTMRDIQGLQAFSS
ncbi:unnamed protein product [Moneuplotes crassus]|uniref:Uncharacterized protein n=1 Tax=Euplotes crassus TaxID=5936 RepID=A0AAD1U8D4_EUPCR|nr:unnamed protein product [Moneuplotes crassus]